LQNERQVRTIGGRNVMVGLVKPARRWAMGRNKPGLIAVNSLGRSWLSRASPTRTLQFPICSASSGLER